MRATFCVLTAVLEARFTPEVIDATQLDDVQPQSRFNLISVALHTAERSTLLKMSKLDEAMDELDASYEALERAIEAARLSAPPPRCAPSRLLETAEPSPERLRAAAADTSLERARAIMGETWTNRLAALLPAGWRLGPCYGNSEGEPFDPPCFDRLECTRVRSVGAVWKLGPSASQGWRFSVLVRNEDEGVVEGCCVRMHEYELNDTFVLEPGEHVESLEVDAVTRIGHRNDYHCAALCGLHFGSTEGQFESFENPSPHLGEAYEQSYATDHCRAGEVIRTFYGRVKTVAPDKWSRMQGLHQDYRILCALGVVYGPGADTAWSPRAPERFSDAATARVDAVLALASADRGPLSRLPEVVVHHVLGFAISLFK